MITPLNGTKTHPLSEHALGALRNIALGPVPTQEINAGVINRLLREDLITIEQMTSPYANGKGKLITWAKITPAGIAVSNRSKTK